MVIIMALTAGTMAISKHAVHKITKIKCFLRNHVQFVSRQMDNKFKKKYVLCKNYNCKTQLEILKYKYLSFLQMFLSSCL